MTGSTLASPTSRSPRSEGAARDDRRRTTDDRQAANDHDSSLVFRPSSPPELAPPAADQGRLEGRVERVAELGGAERAQMYELLERYFCGVTRAQFEADLAEKEWAVLMADGQSGRIQGFSTLMRFRTTVDGQAVVAFFSGDTVIDREYWGETVLPRLWSQHVFGLAAAIADARPYWFLITSGYKTYRFLPVFFREFYPTYLRPTPPAMQRLLDALGQRKFPQEYDPETGVVRLAAPAALRPGVADIAPRRLDDPHVAFYAAANPGHVYGHELACITELSPANLTPAGRRMLGSRQQAVGGAGLCR